MSNPLDALEMLSRRTRNLDAPRGRYTVADAIKLAATMQKEAVTSMPALNASLGLLDTLLWKIPHNIIGRGLGTAAWGVGKGVSGTAGGIARGIKGLADPLVSPIAKALTVPVGGAALKPMWQGASVPGIGQRMAGAMEDLLLYPIQNPGNAMLMGFLGHEAIGKAGRMKALGQVAKPRGPQGGAAKSVFERMG